MLSLGRSIKLTSLKFISPGVISPRQPMHFELISSSARVIVYRRGFYFIVSGSVTFITMKMLSSEAVN